MKGTLRQRFEAKYEPIPECGCWLWTAAENEKGYGVIGVGGRGTGKRYAHRVSYELHVGPVPDGMCVLHKCDTPLCVNPDHLFLGTVADNVNDMTFKDRGKRSKQGLLRGVLRIPECSGRPYMAQCRVGGRVRCSAYYATQEEAHTAYLELLREGRAIVSAKGKSDGH